MPTLLTARPSPDIIAKVLVARASHAHAAGRGLVAALGCAADFAEFDEAVGGGFGVGPAPGVVGVFPAVVGEGGRGEEKG